MPIAYSPTLYIQYEAPHTRFITIVPIQALAALGMRGAELLLNLGIMLVGSLSFIMLLLPPFGALSVILALLSLGIVCAGEVQVLTALYSLRQLAHAPVVN